MGNRSTTDDEALRERAVKRLKKQRDFRIHLLMYVQFNGLLVVIWAMTGAGLRSTKRESKKSTVVVSLPTSRRSPHHHTVDSAGFLTFIQRRADPGHAGADLNLNWYGTFGRGGTSGRPHISTETGQG